MGKWTERTKNEIISNNKAMKMWNNENWNIGTVEQCNNEVIVRWYNSKWNNMD